ncbi:MAG: hypothetical protein EZS28_012385 [Streblomastix strix]|uniref:Uncharacterized protein n=1 Tax=Streblomastix strix TaxID=222440 RepID=A0A5J4WBZ0_9EUKA|nr:MAG: hypothetical protein EZS28_012385 [Streblomastix strix]
MLESLLIAFLCLATVQHASLLMIENIGNEIVNFYVDESSSISKLCGNDRYPCNKIDTMFSYMDRNDQYIIHVYQVFPTIDIVAEGNVLINITGQQHPIRKIIVSFSKFNIDFGDLYFQIDNSDSSLKFSNCNLFRNAGNNAVNSHSLIVVNRGSLILEKLNFNGGKIEGNETLIYSTSPKLIQFTSLTVTNLSLVSKSTAPLLLSATELESESNIIISDIHVKQNTAGTQAEAGIIFIHAIEDQDQIQNEYPSAQPIILIENSEIIQNTLAPILEASAIQVQGLKPLQILIKNSTINNRSPPNTNKQYELKITLPKDCEFNDLITQFQTVDFGITLQPVAVKIYPNDQFSSIAVLLTEQYANLLVRSNGQESCGSYIANFHNDVNAFSCAMIIVREQDALGLLKGVPRSIFIEGSFTENDLRTDSLTISFKGSNTQTSANMISFKPNIPTLSTMSDNALFRVNDGGLVTLNNLFIQRSNQIGSENAPIVVIINGIGQQSNRFQKNSPGKLVIERCILEGGNTAISDVWYDLGLAQTCNVGYYATIVADGQRPAVRALNGASVTIDKNTILNNNGQRNRNTLSSMQTNLVCEGGIGTTTVNIALDNVTSYSLTGNAWIFSSSDNSCIVKATFNGEPAQPRSPPQINSSKISINNSDQQAEVTINGKFLEPCMRRLVLEIHEKDKVDVKVTQEFGYESSSASANWINSVQLIILIPSSLLKDLNTKSIWEVSAYEYGYRELASWTSTQPTEIGIRRTILVVIIVVPIVVIIAIIIFFIIAVICLNNRANKQSDLHHKKNEDTEMNIQIVSLNVKEMKATGKIKHKQQEDPQICKHDIIYEVDKPTQVIDEDYIAELVAHPSLTVLIQTRKHLHHHLHQLKLEM